VIATGQITPTPATGGFNRIDNCGFEDGQTSWDFNAGAQVIYGGNNYGFVATDASRPGISQYFNWPGGLAFVRFKSQGKHSVYLQNFSTGAQYTISNAANSYGGSFVTFYTNTYAPAGLYKIALHLPAQVGPGSFDDISVSENQYVNCEAGSNTEPTPNPTATSQATRTMYPTSTNYPTPTQPATSTGTTTPRPTYTPYPTYTPFPTYTPYVPPPSTSTPRPAATQTPYPTYTPQPTYTIQPSYTMQPSITTGPGTSTPTPQATYTPGIPGLVQGLPTQPPPPQPPPAYYANCRRPQNGFDMADWVEYNRCVSLSYFEWSPNAQSTMEAWPNTFKTREPLGTMNEVEQTVKGINGLINTYNMSEYGVPGTHEQPSMGTFFSQTNNPWETGQFMQTGSTTAPNMVCSTKITGLLGQLTNGYCWLINLLDELHLTPWLQWLINIVSVLFLLAYLWAKFIDAGSGA
jgi:hypothetical protein